MRTLIILLMVLLIGSCNRTVEIEPVTIQGEWQTVEEIRNGAPYVSSYYRWIDRVEIYEITFRLYPGEGAGITSKGHRDYTYELSEEGDRIILTNNSILDVDGLTIDKLTANELWLSDIGELPFEKEYTWKLERVTD